MSNRSTTTTLQPSRRARKAAANPPGPAPITTISACATTGTPCGVTSCAVASTFTKKLLRIWAVRRKSDCLLVGREARFGHDAFPAGMEIPQILVNCFWRRRSRLQTHFFVPGLHFGLLKHFGRKFCQFLAFRLV